MISSGPPNVLRRLCLLEKYAGGSISELKDFFKKDTPKVEAVSYRPNILSKEHTTVLYIKRDHRHVYERDTSLQIEAKMMQPCNEYAQPRIAKWKKTLAQF